MVFEPLSLYLRKTNVFGGMLESVCLSVRVFDRASVLVSVCVQNTTLCRKLFLQSFSNFIKTFYIH